VRKRILIVVIGWLAAVLSIAAIASLAIDTAGRQVIAAPIAAPYPTASAPTATATTRGPSPGPTTSEPNLTARPNSTRTASSKRPRTHPIAATKAPKPSPTPVVSTYSTIAGRVRVGCTGARITLAGGYIQPASGWAVSIRDDGSERVKVRFERYRRRDLIVVAVCASGGPQFAQARSEQKRGDGRHDGNGGGMFADLGSSSDRDQD
jgi:hypothetical protein